MNILRLLAAPYELRRWSLRVSAVTVQQTLSLMPIPL